MADSLRDCNSIHQGFINKCKVCGGVTTLKLCARCKHVAYCSKEHQKQDWIDHKVFCKTYCQEINNVAKSGENQESFRSSPMGVVSRHLQSLSIYSQDVVANVTSESSHVMNQVKPTDERSNELFTNTSSLLPEDNRQSNVTEIDVDKFIKSENSHSDQTNSRNNIAEDSSVTKTSDNKRSNDFEIESGSSEKFILESEESQLHAPDYSKETGVPDNQPSVDSSMPYISVVQSRNKALSDYVIKCLNSYGLCVIDNFLGDSKGTDILDDVTDLYDQGSLSSGELVNTASPKGAVRGDVITWVEGTELGCNNIAFLISSIDAIMLHCQRSLGQYHIKGRSKV